MRETRRRIALTIGDPAGIGPEIVTTLLGRGRLDRSDLWIIGSLGPMNKELGEEVSVAAEAVTAEEALSGKRPVAFPAFIDLTGGLDVEQGCPSAESGLISGRSVELAINMAKQGLIDGIVTGPASKEALHLGGYHYNGHTAMLSELMDAPDCQMLMVSGKLRILILTRDIPLAGVSAQITEDLIITGVRVTRDSLVRDFGIKAPVIRVAALNPHAGDGGINGREEIDIIAPAIEKLRAEGIDADGPVPADTLFCSRENKKADAFIALYHDQGMIPFKINGFTGGVNMTIGLPIIRTSVCHGTAYDIAGKSVASTGSLEAALTLAEQCLSKRKEKTGV